MDGYETLNSQEIKDDVNPLILDFFKQFSEVENVKVEIVQKAMMAYIDPAIAERINSVAKAQGLEGSVGDFEMTARIKAAENIFAKNS